MCLVFIMYASANCKNLHFTSTHINKNSDLSVYINIYAWKLRSEKLTLKVGEWESSDGNLSHTACQENTSDPPTGSEVICLGSPVWTYTQQSYASVHHTALCTALRETRNPAATGASWLWGKGMVRFSVSHNGYKATAVIKMHREKVSFLLHNLAD